MTISQDLVAAAVIVGLIPLLFLSSLPGDSIYFFLLIIALLLALSTCSTGRFISITICSFLWGVGIAQYSVTKIEGYADRSIEAVGVIKTVNIGQTKRSLTLFTVKLINNQPLFWFQQFDVVLFWAKNKTETMAGQQWQFTIKLRPIHSRLNEGNFDSQRWAIANNQLFTGLVIQARLVNDSSSVRQQFINYFLPKINKLSTVDLLVGLLFGERALIGSERKSLLLQTSTAHLMAISGLHISLAAFVGWFLARGSQLFFPVHFIGMNYPKLISWLVAASYVWLSGGNLPAIRAILALTYWYYLSATGRSLHLWQVWLHIVAFFLIINPLTILSDSLWLSCGAVAVLIFWFQWAPLAKRFNKKPWFFLRWIHLQTAIVLLLMPLQLAIFNGISWQALAANLWAVPIVSFITIPFMLLALFFDPIALISNLFLSVADISLQLLLPFLNKMTTGWLSVSQHWHAISFIGWPLVVIWRLKLLQHHLILIIGFLLLMILPFYQSVDHRWRLDMLDVGHGLAVVIQRGGRALLYDTGQPLMAEKEVIPFLQRHGLILDGIIISHEDNDHVGGLAILQQYYPKSWLRTASGLLNSKSCTQGDNWYWQGLEFTVLWPPKKVAKSTNADSCVVRIDDNQHKVLLTGDLEQAQELALVRTNRAALSSHILQVPHHGSKTSSTSAFLRAVAPDVGLVSISRYNPWSLPAKNIKQRYYKLGISWQTTAVSGQLTVLFFDANWQLSVFREQIMPRWYHQWFGDK